jgi:uncharacterized low-complexity protein
MKKINPLLPAIGAVFAATVLSPLASAADSPFAMQKLSGGYQLAAADTAEKKMDGKCGEGKCGADKKAMKKKDGKCGEGKCGADKMKNKDAAKCGEGKCVR